MYIANSLNEEQMEHNIFRLTDIDKESPTMLVTPVSKYEDVALIPLETTVEPLVSFLYDMQSCASIVIQRCRKRPLDRLTNDESASLRSIKSC
jgi:hypothetical protein